MSLLISSRAAAARQAAAGCWTCCHARLVGSHRGFARVSSAARLQAEEEVEAESTTSAVSSIPAVSPAADLSAAADRSSPQHRRWKRDRPQQHRGSSFSTRPVRLRLPPAPPALYPTPHTAAGALPKAVPSVPASRLSPSQSFAPIGTSGGDIVLPFSPPSPDSLSGQPPAQLSTPPSPSPSQPASPSRASLRPIIIYASEAASISGLNPHRSFLSAFDSVWMRTEGELYSRVKAAVEAERREAVLSEEERVQAALSSTDLPHYVESLLPEVPSLSPSEMTELYRDIRTRVSASSVPVAMQSPALAQLCSVVNRVFGIESEKRVIASMREDGIVVKKNNRVLYKKIMGAAADASAAAAAAAAASPAASALSASSAAPTRAWLLAGRVDGFIDGQLVEIKSRTRCFLSPLPLWDRCQFECYLQILDLQQGQMLEVLRERTTASASAAAAAMSERRKRTLLRRDDSVWQSRIRPQLQRFVDFLHGFMQDEHRMRQYLAAPPDGRLLMLADVVPSSIQKIYREGRRSRKGWRGGMGMGMA